MVLVTCIPTESLLVTGDLNFCSGVQLYKWLEMATMLHTCRLVMGDSSIDSPTYPMAQLTVRYGSHGPVSSLIYLKITYEK